MPSQSLPEPEGVRDVLNGLLGRDITVSRAHPDSLGFDKPVVVATYEREDGAIGGLVVADLTVSAYSGAALALIPKAVADENIADGVIEEMLLENFHEVLNVGAQWFAARANPRVSLTTVYGPKDRPPNEVGVVMAGPAERADFDVSVTGYGDGRIRFLSTPF